ncbi:MAG: hypothetical protein AB1540_03900 [Bdellovibrionota bacterium]
MEWVQCVRATKCLFVFLGLAGSAHAQISGSLLTFDYDLKFNAKFRRDFAPLTQMQQSVSGPTLFNSGRALPHELMADLYPNLAETSLTDLRKSSCYWMPRGEQLNLSWEVVAKFDSASHTPRPAAVAGCTFTDPVTRRPVVNRLGSPLSAGFFRKDIHAIVQFWESSGAPNEHDDCFSSPGKSVSLGQVSSNTLEANPQLCLPSGERIAIDPFCQLDCKIAPRSTLDTSFILQLRSNTRFANRYLMDTREHGPVVKTVDGVRILSRQLTRDRRSSSILSIYTWETQNNQDGTWRENFSPNLFIHAAKVWVPHPSRPSEKIHLEPSRMLVGQQGCALARGMAEPGINTVTCPVLSNATPTFLSGIARQKLNWRIEFDGVPTYRVDEPSYSTTRTLGEKDPVFIEFRIGAKNTQPRLVTTPSSIRFAGVNSNSSFTSYPNPIRIENHGSAPAKILGMWFEGRDALAFTLSTASSGQANPVLAAGVTEFFRIGVLGPFPATYIGLEASLVICHGSQNQSAVVRGNCNASVARLPISAPLGAGIVQLLYPTNQNVPVGFARNFSFNFIDNDPANENQYIKPIIIQNVGQGTATISAVRIAGPDSAFFQIHVPRSSSDQRWSAVMRPLTGLQIPLVPGGSADFWIRFDPAGQRTHSAQFSVETDSGNVVLDLIGETYQTNVGP